jgi:regulator of replication initiation timing
MGILDGIEKLITEHGSAAILRERVALAKEQYQALERDNATLKQENATLRQENDRLQLDNYKLKEKLENLEKQIAHSHGDRLDEISEKMLIALANSDRALTEQLIAHVGQGPAKGKYHLDILREKKFAIQAAATPRGAMWMATSEGRKYLANHNLL